MPLIVGARSARASFHNTLHRPWTRLQGVVGALALANSGTKCMQMCALHTAAPATLHDSIGNCFSTHECHGVQDIDNRDLKMSKYAGKVLLVCNVASQCGFTPQVRVLSPYG